MLDTNDAAQDPLDELLVTAHEIDRKQVADLCRGRLVVDPSANRFLFAQGIRNQATIPQQVLLALLGQLVLHLKGDDLPRGMRPQEISEAIGVAGSSLRPALMRLARRGLIRKDREEYVVPPYSLDAIQAELGDLS